MGTWQCYLALLLSKVLSNALHFNLLHINALHITALHFNLLHISALHINALHFNLLHISALHINALNINLHINYTLEIYSFFGGRPWSGRCLRKCNLYVVSCVSIARNSLNLRFAPAGTVRVFLKMCFLIVRFVILFEFEGTIARKLRFHIFNFSNLKEPSHENFVFTSSTFQIWRTHRTESFVFTSSTFWIWRKHRTKASFSHLQLFKFEGRIALKASFSHL